METEAAKEHSVDTAFHVVTQQALGSFLSKCSLHGAAEELSSDQAEPGPQPPERQSEEAGIRGRELETWETGG